MSAASLHIVAVIPHPDDEAWAMANTLAACARHGHRVHVVCATDGEAGRHSIQRLTPDELRACRRAELADSCRVLGVQTPIFLGLPDGGLADVDSSRWDTVLTAHVAPLRPDLILTLGRDGGYGHVDHVACTNAVMAWTSQRNVPHLLHVTPPGAFTEFADRLRKFAPKLLVSSEHMNSLISPSPAFCVQVATTDWRPVATAMHKSQLPHKGPEYFLFSGIWQVLGPRECWCWAHACRPESGTPGAPFVPVLAVHGR